jgi:2-polyprenyl-3-methyl-5-hydroxy-6-metoxy-1,4-benzoquinol methylase
MSVKDQNYWRCARCEARFLDPRQRMSVIEERAHYLTHENDPSDLGYRTFLSKLSIPLLERLAPGLRGLDFGCGPGPALAGMLAEAGHVMANYDPFFAPDAEALGRTYDFITCTEVLEHLHHPAKVLDQLDGLLCPGGWLGLMTEFQTEDSRFANWRYRREPTHIVFYREETLRLIARERGWSCEVPAKDVAIMHKPAKQDGDELQSLD